MHISDYLRSVISIQGLNAAADGNVSIVEKCLKTIPTAVEIVKQMMALSKQGLGEFERNFIQEELDKIRKDWNILKQRLDSVDKNISEEVIDALNHIVAVSQSLHYLQN